MTVHFYFTDESLFVANPKFIASFREKQLLIFYIENKTYTDNSKIAGKTNGDEKGNGNEMN